MVVHLMTVTTQMGERPDPVAERVTHPLTLLDYLILEDAPPNLSWTRRRTPLLRREREWFAVFTITDNRGCAGVPALVSVVGAKRSRGESR